MKSKNALNPAWYSRIIAVSLLFLGSGSAKAQLATHVGVATSPSVWSYTLFNDEPAGSTNFLDDFILAVNATFTVTGTPDGWASQTDNTSYVEWYNTDVVLPYPHDVAPGASLSGFSISSTETHSDGLDYSIQSWDHNADAPGAPSAGTVLAPSTPAAAPELHSLTVFGLGTLAVGLLALRRRRCIAHETWHNAS